MFDDPTGCYAPSWPIAIDREPRMNVAKMGDGYEQRILDGLNWMETTWNLKWPMRPRAILMDMDGFLTSQQGGAFDFYDQLSQQIVSVFCDKWSVNFSYQGNKADYGDMDAEFRIANGDGVIGALL